MGNNLDLVKWLMNTHRRDVKALDSLVRFLPIKYLADSLKGIFHITLGMPWGQRGNSAISC